MFVIGMKMFYWRARNYFYTQIWFNIQNYRMVPFLIMLYLLQGDAVTASSIENIFSLPEAILLFCAYRLMEEIGLPAEECGVRVNGVYQYLVRLRVKKLGSIYLMCKLEGILKHWFIGIVVMFLFSKNLTWLSVGGIYSFLIYMLIALDHVVFSLVCNAISDIQERVEYLRHTRMLLGSAFVFSLLSLVGNTNWNPFSALSVKVSVFLVVAAMARNIVRFLTTAPLSKLKYADFLHDSMLSKSIEKMNAFFNKVYGFTQKVAGNTNFTFVFSKNISQLIMEKSAARASLVLPVFSMLMALGPFFPASERAVAFGFSYVFVSAIFSLFNALSYFARETNNIWILKLHKLKLDMFYTGKLVANLIFAGIVNSGLFILHEGIRIFYLHSPTIFSYLYLYGILLAVPIGTIVGAALGSYLVPPVCSEGGQIYYDNNAQGIIVFYMFIHEKFIFLPISWLLFAKGNVFLLCSGIAFGYISALFLGTRALYKRKLHAA